jgi:hypothetical protein
VAPLSSPQLVYACTSQIRSAYRRKGETAALSAKQANIGGSINPGLVGGSGIWSRLRPTAVLYAVNCFNDFPTLLTSIAVIRIASPVVNKLTPTIRPSVQLALCGQK